VLPPSALWGSLVNSGYQVVYALEVEGIPFIFAEREMWTTRGLAVGYHNLDDLTISYALAIMEGDRIDQACNREEGLATGRAVAFTLGRQQLADESLGSALFARPTYRATLATTVSDPAMDTFSVDSTTGFAATGLLYIGRECVRYTSLTATEFGGLVRGVAGYPHYHTASTASAYRQCTDKPVYWRGRLVTLWAHLVSPEGRFLGDRWAELGEWCRQDWRGYVRDTPRPEQAGMVLTCLPLVRLAAQEFGAEISGKMQPEYIVSAPGDTLLLPAYDVIGPSAPIAGATGIISLANWCIIAGNNMTGTYGAGVYLRVTIEPVLHGEDRKIRVRIAGAIRYVIRSSAWFLEAGQYVTEAHGSLFTQCFIPLMSNSSTPAGNTAWIVMEPDPQVDFSDAEVGATGLLALDIGGDTEIVSYDETRLSDDRVQRAFRISSRNVLGLEGGDLRNPWKNDTTVRVVAGAAGPWAECLATLMTSSGTGDRGAFDTLAHGFGIGVPATWVATGRTGSGADVGMLLQQPLTAVTIGKTSVKDMLCGWLALMSMCLVQRRDVNGAIGIDVAATFTANHADTALATTDVLLDGHETPEMMEAPNHIRIIASDYLTTRPVVVVRDGARAQAEGVRSMEVKAPSIGRLQALDLGGGLLLLGDGQATVSMRLAPWVEVQIGDSRELTTAHPAVWDWSGGAYAPASVMARVVGTSRDLWSQVQDVTLLLAGQAAEVVYLCPSAIVEETVSSTVYRVAAGDAAEFEVSDAIILYSRGNENATWAQRTITAIYEGESYDAITINSAASLTGEIVITFDGYATAVTRQRRFMFVQADKVWS
jgi:hypothetical protein